MNTKINFMAGLPAAAATVAGDLGLEVGQTWRTRHGDVVTIISKRGDGNFALQRETGFENRYLVKPNGVSIYHGSALHDLVEQVQRVYIAGPMTGYPDLNFPAFHAAAAEYRKRGCFVINPAEMNGGDCEPELYAKMTTEQKDAHWVKCMTKDINALLTCEMVVMLDGWTKSKGATLEHHIARSLGMIISYPVDTYVA